MTTSSRKPNSWDVCVARVQFQDKPKAKARPCLIHSKDGFSFLVFKITTKDKNSEWSCIKLDNWKELGLKRLSWLQLNPEFVVYENDIAVVLSKAPKELIQKIRKNLEML